MARAGSQRGRTAEAPATIRFPDRHARVTPPDLLTTRRLAPTTGSARADHHDRVDDPPPRAPLIESEHYEQRLRAALDADVGVDDPLDALVSLLADSGTEAGRGRALAERELGTLAARRPALRGLAQGWRSAVADIVRTRTNDPTTITAVIAVADGLCASVLLGELPPDTALIREVLERTLAPTGP